MDTLSNCYEISNLIEVMVSCSDEVLDFLYSCYIYPNPADQILTIETNLSTEKTIYITNTHGQLIHTIQSSETIVHIDIKDLAIGMYFIQMEDGAYSVTEKFVKQ